MNFDVIGTARRRTRRVLARAVVVVVVAAGGVYGAGLYVNAHLDDPPGPPPAPTVALPWPADSAAPDAALLPADVTWVRLGGVDLPAGAGTGPAQTSGGLARGFAHTQAGAVVAAVHLLVRTTAQVGPSVFEPTLAGQVVGEHAPAMAAVVTDAYRQGAAAAGVPYGQPLGDLPAVLVGVRIDAYSDTRAVLSVLTSATDLTGVTRYAATTVTVLWVRGDWRLLAPPQGRWDSQVHIVDAATVGGFTPLRAR